MAMMSRLQLPRLSVVLVRDVHHSRIADRSVRCDEWYDSAFGRNKTINGPGRAPFFCEFSCLHPNGRISDVRQLPRMLPATPQKASKRGQMPRRTHAAVKLAAAVRRALTSESIEER